MTLSLTGGTVVQSLAPARLAQSDLAVTGGRIVRADGAPTATERLDCSGCLIVPGNVCAHMHLYSALARGMPFRLEAPKTFVEILQRVWWRLDRALDEASIQASALAGGISALLAGTTTVVDHHASPNAIDGSLDLIAESLESLGVRSVLCYEVTDRDGVKRANAGIEENRRFLSEHRSPLTRGMVGAHASFTLSAETLAGCVQAAADFDAGIHIHVAEDAADQRDAEVRYGARVVQRLAKADALRHDSLLAHCVHLDRAEMELVREAGATVAHNPRSNMNNGVGRAPVVALGSRVALGTDGIDGDMFAESRAAYFRRREDDVTAVPAWAIRRLGEGARLVGRLFDEEKMGHLEPGVPADLIVLQYPDSTPLSDDNLPGHWIFGLGSAQVRDVMVNGELVVRDGRLTRLDQDEILAGARTQAAALWERMDEVRAHSFGPKGG
jgi:putative selenium metabolism protein SsnA